MAEKKKDTSKITCPSCGLYRFGFRNDYGICVICGWEKAQKGETDLKCNAGKACKTTESRQKSR